MLGLGSAVLSVVAVPVLYVLVVMGEAPAEALYPTDIGDTPPEVLASQVFVREWKHIYELGDGLYIMHPFLLLTPAIAAAYLLGVPFLIWRLRRSLAAQLLLGVLLAATVVSYVPPVATFVGEYLIAPGQLYRMAWPISPVAMLILGWLAWEATGYAAGVHHRLGIPRFLRRSLPVAAVVILAVAVALPSSLGSLRDVYEAKDVSFEPPFVSDPIFRWMQHNIEEPGVVLAPDAKNLIIPAYSAELNVVSFRGAPFLDNLEALERC